MGLYGRQVLRHEVADVLEVARSTRLPLENTTKGLRSKRHEVEDQREVEELYHVGVKNTGRHTIDVDNVCGKGAEVRSCQKRVQGTLQVYTGGFQKPLGSQYI